jgi:hypothetical protein
VAIGLGAGLLMPSLTLPPVIGSERVVNLLFTIGFGVIGLVSIIYSLLFLVVQWAATTFTPAWTCSVTTQLSGVPSPSPSASSSSASPRACPSAPAKKSRSRSR